MLAKYSPISNVIFLMAIRFHTFSQVDFPLPLCTRMHFVFISSSDKNADILRRHQIYSDYFLSYTNRKVADFNLDFFSQSKNTRNTKTSAERGLFFAHCTKVFATFSLSFA